MSKRALAAALVATTAIVGCATVDPYTGQRDVNRTATGAIVGGILGAAAGTAAGGDDRRNAVIGAGVGAIAGAAAGAYMDRQERILRERMANSRVEVIRTGENEILLNMPSDVTFGFDSAELRSEFRGTLGEVAQTLQEFPNTTVDVVGHADATGPDDYNLRLSQRRADTVASFLASRGVIRERLLTQGMGESQPVASNATPEGRARNRRVEVRVRAVTA